MCPPCEMKIVRFGGFAVGELGPLYHWSPRERLSGIKRLGLVPGKRNFHGSTYTNHVTVASRRNTFSRP